jgi:hypothetical protein
MSKYFEHIWPNNTLFVNTQKRRRSSMIRKRYSWEKRGWNDNHSNMFFLTCEIWRPMSHACVVIVWITMSGEPFQWCVKAYCVPVKCKRDNFIMFSQYFHHFSFLDMESFLSFYQIIYWSQENSTIHWVKWFANWRISLFDNLPYFSSHGLLPSFCMGWLLWKNNFLSCCNYVGKPCTAQNMRVPSFLRVRIFPVN